MRSGMFGLHWVKIEMGRMPKAGILVMKPRLHIFVSNILIHIIRFRTTRLTASSSLSQGYMLHPLPSPYPSNPCNPTDLSELHPIHFQHQNPSHPPTHPPATLETSTLHPPSNPFVPPVPLPSQLLSTSLAYPCTSATETLTFFPRSPSAAEDNVMVQGP